MAGQLRPGQRVAYTAWRWSGSRFEKVTRAATVVAVDGRKVRVITAFDGCRVWFPAGQLAAVRRP